MFGKRRRNVNYYCWMCEDIRKVGLFFRRVCPECEGDPIGTFLKRYPRPKPPPCPPKGSKVLPLKPWSKPPPGKVIVIIPNKQYCEIINGFIEEVEKRTKKLRGDTEVKKDKTLSYIAMKQIQKEINNVKS